jgi:hypothetical protein
LTALTRENEGQVSRWFAAAKKYVAHDLGEVIRTGLGQCRLDFGQVGF